jgi:hypothetical protein
MRCRHAFVEVILQTIEPMVAPNILWCVPHRHRHRMDTGTDMDTGTILKIMLIFMETHGLTVTTVTHETFVARETNLGTGENVVELAHLPVQQAHLFARNHKLPCLGAMYDGKTDFTLWA